MRTTVTLEEDVERLLREAMHRSRTSFKATLAIEHDAVLHTADADFVRFPGSRWFNPLTGTGRTGLRRTRAA